MKVKISEGSAWADRLVWLLPGLAIVALIALILMPLGVVLLTSLLSSPLGTDPSFTLANYQAILTDASSVRLLQNSVIFVLGASITAMVLATLFAWLVTSFDVPARRILRLLPLMVLLAPALLKDPAWIELYHSDIGLVNRAIEYVFGVDQGPFNIYSMPGMIAVVGVSIVPIPYLVLLAPFDSLDRSFLEASEMSGAGRMRTLIRVVVPVLAPAFLSALALTLIITASAFETPILIGLPGGIGTYMSAVYRSMSTADPNLNFASAQATLYLALTSLLLMWYLVVTRRERRFVSVGGRGARPNLLKAPVLGGFLVLLLLGHFIVSFVMPIAVTVLVSLLPYYTIAPGTTLPPATLDNYSAILDGRTFGALINSVVLSSITTVTAVGGAVALALVALKSRFRGRRAVEAIGTVPIGVPAIVFSVALLVAFISIPVLRPLYGTHIPLVLGAMVVFLPIALRVTSSALIQIQDDLLDASRMSGAGRLQTWRRVLLPLWRPALLYAGAAVFVLSFRELAAVILLVTANTSLIPTATFTAWDDGRLGQVAALNLFSLLVPLLVVSAALAIGAPRRSRTGRLARLFR